MRNTTLLVTAVLLTACTTTPDPAKICTAEWITPRVDRAVDRIETRLEKTLKALQSVAGSRVAGETPGPIQMFRLSNAAKNLEKELENGRGIQDLRTVASTCNDPELIRNQVYALLEKEGVSNDIVSFLEITGILDQIIATAEGVE